jgi:hypothetical protein
MNSIAIKPTNFVIEQSPLHYYPLKFQKLTMKGQELGTASVPPTIPTTGVLLWGGEAGPTPQAIFCCLD